MGRARYASPYVYLGQPRFLTTVYTSLFRSSWREPASSRIAIFVQIFVSSANILMLFFIQSGKSRTNMRNNSGPSTDPWGTPLMTSIHSEKLPRTKTLIFLCFRKFPIHANNFPSNPNPLIVSNNRWCGTLSNAFL